MTAPETGNPIHPVDRIVSIHFDHVSFSYGDVKVLEDVSFHIHQGEFVALVGPNGSGKTTILKLLLGLESPASGLVELFGAPRGKKVFQDRIGYVPQQPPNDVVFPATVRDVVRMGRLRSMKPYTAEDRAAAEEALVQAEIADLAGRPYGALSGGQRRRVLVARALASLAGVKASAPALLILDEPTANMDAESERRLFRVLGKLKGSATILIVTHDTDFVSALSGRVLCMGENGTHGIVQHRTESADGARGTSRVIHRESIPADDCWDGER